MTASPVIQIAVARFAPTTAAVGSIRANTARTLQDWRVDPDAVEVARTIVSELASNAARVSRPDEFVAVRLTATNGTIVIEVWDARDTETPRMGHPNAESENGRGLLIVDSLSTRWDWYTARSGGKIVWAQFPFQPPQEPEEPAGNALLPKRIPETGPPPSMPVDYNDDPETLRRVVGALRRLGDDWHQPRPAGDRMSA